MSDRRLNRIAAVVAIVGGIAALLVIFDDYGFLKKNYFDGLPEESQWKVYGPVDGGTYQGQISNIKKEKTGLIYYNDKEKPTYHEFQFSSKNEYYNIKTSEHIRFTSDSTAIQEYCCNRGKLNLKRIKSK